MRKRQRKAGPTSRRKFVVLTPDVFEAHLALKAEVARRRLTDRLSWTEYLRILAAEYLGELKGGEK